MRFPGRDNRVETTYGIMRPVGVSQWLAFDRLNTYRCCGVDLGALKFPARQKGSNRNFWGASNV